jgi:hypothetical protein
MDLIRNTLSSTGLLAQGVLPTLVMIVSTRFNSGEAIIKASKALAIVK